MIQDRVRAGSIAYADEVSCWEMLHSRYLTKRINDTQANSTNDACTKSSGVVFSPGYAAPKSERIINRWPVPRCLCR